MAQEKTEKTSSSAKATEDKEIKEEEVGEIMHYFGKIKVGVVKITKDGLKVGDRIHIKGGETDLEQEVTSLQIEKDSVKEIKKGDEAGMKVDAKVREGNKVFKVVE